MTITKKTESEWINTVLKKGTLADKLAAHTLLIHESKSWSSLASLIALVDPRKCRRQCMMAMMTLKELFLDSLNISKPNSAVKSDDDKTKVRFYYTKFIDQLGLVAFDSLEETRKKAIWILSELLNKHSENKEYIIEKMVNKIGDKIPKLATTAGHLVEKAVNSEKPEIRHKTIKCVQRFLRNSTLTPQARYYAISLLTRIKLVKGCHEMANQLMATYLEIYAKLTKEKEIESRLMNAILVGIHRAYPYSKIGNDVFEEHLQSLYALVNRVNFKMSVVAMELIKNIVSKRPEFEDRFYNLVFGQLIRPELQTCSRKQAFASFLLGVINGDTKLERKAAFVKRMLLVALNSKPDFAQVLLTTITQVNGFKMILSANDADKNHLNELYLLRNHYDPAISNLAINMCVYI